MEHKYFSVGDHRRERWKSPIHQSLSLTRNRTVTVANCATPVDNHQALRDLSQVLPLPPTASCGTCDAPQET